MKYAAFLVCLAAGFMAADSSLAQETNAPPVAATNAPAKLIDPDAAGWTSAVFSAPPP